jgi:hypothetical protein
MSTIEPRRISREDCVEQSVEDFVLGALLARGFPEAAFEIVDAYAAERFDGDLQQSYVAIGLSFDDGGELGELGSDLRLRTYVIEIMVYGSAGRRGQQLAHGIRDAFDEAGVIPLKDIRVPSTPVVDKLVVDNIRVEREEREEPKPFERFMWSVTVPVLDEFYPSSW